MPLPSDQYAFLAFRIYEPLFARSDIESNSRRFNVKHVSPPSATNYRGAVVKDEATGQLIVVNKGTDATNFHDLITDAAMGTMGAPAQWPEAAHLMRVALDIAKRERISISELSVTGHSLGGALAQLQAALPEATGVHVETFNAYGAHSMAETLSRRQPLHIASAQDRVINHRMYHDPVSAAARHIGSTVDYMDHGDYQRHSRGGLAPLAEAGAIAASHGIGNFWDRERNQPGAVFAHNYMIDLGHRPLDDLPPGVPLDLSAPWHLLGAHESDPSPSHARHSASTSPKLNPETQALYGVIQKRVPDAGPKRLMQFTAACHENGITAANLDAIHLDEERMTIEFQGKGWLAVPTVIDLRKDAPSHEQSMQLVREVDQRAMEIEQHLAQSARLSQRGPAL